MFQTGQDCGGGYIKLLSQSNSLDLNKFNDKVGKKVQQKLSILAIRHYKFLLSHGFYQKHQLITNKDDLLCLVGSK